MTAHWIRRFLIMAAVMTSVVVMPSRPALACSCMPADPATTLNEVPAAFIGTVIDVSRAERPTETQDVVFTFQVDEWVKGDLGPTVEMLSSGDGASCGFEMSPGQQSGVYVRRVSAELTGGLCDRVDGELLRAAAQGAPAPTGTGPISFLVAGAFGGAGLIALDADGEILGYGPPATEDGSFYFPAISVCPGSTRLVELVEDDRVVVRDLASLQVVDDMRVGVSETEDGYTYFNSVACRSEDAGEILVFGTSETINEQEFTEGEEFSEEEYFANQRGVIYSLGPDGFRLFSEIPFGSEGGRILVGPSTAVAQGRPGSGELIAIDLDTGESNVLHRYEPPLGSDELPFVEGLALSPSGRFVAAMDASLMDPGVDYYLSVFDLAADDPLQARAKMLEFGVITWIDDATVSFALQYHDHDEAGEPLPGGESGTLQLYRASDLSLIGQWGPWSAGDAVSADGVLYGVSFEGEKLVSAPALSGPMTELHGFPGSVRSLIAISDGPQIDPTAQEPPQPSGWGVPPATGLPLTTDDPADPAAGPPPGEAGGDFDDVDERLGAGSVVLMAVAGALVVVTLVLVWRRRRRSPETS